MLQSLLNDPQLLTELEKPRRQQIPPGPFTLCEINWSSDLVQQGSSLQPVQKAFILSARLEDLLRGIEKDTVEFSLQIRDSKQNKPQALQRPTCDSFLLKQKFCCSFGPEDYRTVQSQVQDPASKPAKGKGSRRARVALGESIKRGCQYSFTSKQLYKWPDVTELTLHSDQHCDLNGLACHGANDSSADSTRAALAPHLSSEMREWVANQLRLGIPVIGIMSMHIKHLAAKIDKGAASHRYFVVYDLASLLDRWVWFTSTSVLWELVKILSLSIKWLIAWLNAETIS